MQDPLASDITHRLTTVDDDGQVIAYLDYIVEPGQVIDILYTYVEPVHRGKKLSKALVRQVMDLAQANNYSLKAMCSHAHHVIKRIKAQEVED